MKSETDDGLSCFSKFPERRTDPELTVNKPVLTEIELLKRKISDKELESLRAVLNRNAEVILRPAIYMVGVSGHKTKGSESPQQLQQLQRNEHRHKFWLV